MFWLLLCLCLKSKYICRPYVKIENCLGLFSFSFSTSLKSHYHENSVCPICGYVTTLSAAHCEGGNEGPTRETSQAVFMIEQTSVSYPWIQLIQQSNHLLLLFGRAHQNAKSFISQHRQSGAENTVWRARPHRSVSRLLLRYSEFLSPHRSVDETVELTGGS